MTFAICLNTANTFYWSRRALADAVTAGDISISGGVVTVSNASAFYAKGEATHWAQSGQGSIPVATSTKKPREGRVWFHYPGQADAASAYVLTNASSASTGPSATARLVDSGGSTVPQISTASYNANGLITQSVDPLGRETDYAYDTKNIDLLTVKQKTGSSTYDTLSTMTYNSSPNTPLHVPLTVKDASGQTTTLTYYGNGQLNTRKVVVNGANQTTTLAYFSSGYLQTVTGPVSGATTNYTYDSAGRVQTVTDSEGYVLTMAYDNLDRPVSTTYPGTPTTTPVDTKTDITVYNKLDVAQTVDRQGRTSYRYYDAIRELVQTTDPLGRGTWYTWCSCGGLSTLTDANGKVTTWGLDRQGRVTSKTYADTSAISYVYETNTSRLHTMTDAKGNVATAGGVVIYELLRKYRRLSENVRINR